MSYAAQVPEKSETDRVSDQLKTPAAALDTCLSVLENPALGGEERQEFQRRCRNEVDGLKALLEALLQISQMEAGLIQVNRKSAVLLDPLILAVNRIYPKASEKQIEFVFHYEKEIEKQKIMQDVKWLCEALINLLDNAVKYSPSQSEIRICVQQFYKT